MYPYLSLPGRLGKPANDCVALAGRLNSETWELLVTKSSERRNMSYNYNYWLGPTRGTMAGLWAADTTLRQSACFILIARQAAHILPRT